VLAEHRHGGLQGDGLGQVRLDQALTHPAHRDRVEVVGGHRGEHLAGQLQQQRAQRRLAGRHPARPGHPGLPVVSQLFGGRRPDRRRLRPAGQSRRPSAAKPG
jgi:hypothetical protein